MKLAKLALRMPDDIWALFEPILPPVVYAGTGRKPCSNHACLHGLLYVLITGIGWEYVPPCFPCGDTIQERLRLWLQRDCFPTAWQQLAQRYQQLHGINWDKILIDGSKKPAKKGGEETGPSPVDRSKSGTTIHLATDEHGLPLGATITKAGANDGVQTQQVLESLVVKPPPPETPVANPDPRDLPRARAISASLALHCLSRYWANFCGARVPRRIARRMARPLTPVMSLRISVSLRFICSRAFCRCCTCRLAWRIRLARCRR